MLWPIIGRLIIGAK